MQKVIERPELTAVPSSARVLAAEAAPVTAGFTAVDQVLAAFGRELQDDPVVPELRALFDAQRARLEALAHPADDVPAIAWTEPSPADLAAARRALGLAP